MKFSIRLLISSLILVSAAAGAVAQGSGVDQLIASGGEYYRNGMYKKAANDFRNAFNKDRENLDAARGLGNAAMQLKDWRNAKLGLEAAHRLAPEDCSITKSLAYVYMALKLKDRAKGIYEIVIGKGGRAGCEPGNNFAKVNLASLYLQSKQPAEKERALPLLMQVVKSGEEDTGLLVRAHNYAGIIYRQKKNYDLAIEHLEKVFEYDAERVQGRDKLGQLYFNKGDYEKALAHLEIAYELDGNNYNTNLMLGLCYNEMPRHEDDARTHFQKAVNLIKTMPPAKQPKTNLPHRYLAELLNAMGEPRDAIAMSEEGMELAGEGSEYAGLVCTKAKGKEKLGKFEEALELFESIMDDAQYGRYAGQQVRRQEQLIQRKEAQDSQ
jgi:tetratricopeptide (TPR) repeat protein